MVDVIFDCIGSVTIHVYCRGMVIRCLYVLSYIWAISFFIWILFVLVLIYFSRLHSCVEIFTRGMCRGGNMCLGSLFWVNKSFSFKVFSYIVYCFLV